MLSWLDRPSDAVTEVHGAIEENKVVLNDWDDVIERYHSSGYRTQKNTGGKVLDDYENQGFEMVSLILTQMTAGIPRWRVKSARAGSQKPVAKAVQMALNRWSRASKLREFSDRLGLNFLLKYAVAIVTRNGDPRDGQYGDEKGWPSARSLDPNDFIYDPVAPEREDWRYSGHRVTRDKEDLVSEARNDPNTLWNLDVVESMQEGERDPEDPSKSLTHADRKEVQYWEVWVPEIELDSFPGPWEEKIEKSTFTNKDRPTSEDGFNGTIFTVALNIGAGETATDFPRDPFPYWGPPSGPYAVGGEYPVTGHSIPLSTLSATKPQAEHRNAHKRAMLDSMNSYARGVLVAGISGSDDEDGNLAETVVDMEHDNVYVLENVDDISRKVVSFEKGGITQQHLAMDERNKEMLDRATGILDSQRGNVGGSGTATEHAIAGSASATRNSRKLDRFKALMMEVGEKVSWYLYHDDTVEFLIGEEFPGQFMTEFGEPIEELKYQGGAAEGETLAYEDLELEIEPYSMERTSEGLQQARMAQMDAAVQMVATLGPQTPYIDWEAWLQLKGETLNVPNFGDLIDTQLMRQWGMLLMGAQGEAPSPKQNPRPEPHFLKGTYPDNRTGAKEVTLGKTEGALSTQALGAN